MKSLYIYCGQFAIKKDTQTHGINESYTYNFYKAALSKFDRVLLYGGSSLSGSDLFTDSAESFILDNSVDYLFRNNDPRLYQQFLDLSLDDPEGLLFIPRLSHPEYLYSELMFRGISMPNNLYFSIFAFELISKSMPRSLLFENLVAQPAVAKVSIHSIDIQPKAPSYFPLEEFVTNQKVTVCSEPSNYINHPSINASLITEIHQFPSFDPEKQTFLYVGAAFYGKGPDFFINAALEMPQANFVMAGDFRGTQNFEMKYDPFSIPNLTIYDHFIPDDYIYTLMTLTNYVVMPYRSTYRYGTSNIFYLSMLHRKPVIVPDIEPFTSLISSNRVGYLFEADDQLSLNEILTKALNVNSSFINSDFDNYHSSSIHDYSVFVQKIFP